jgi:hypothetical protein
MDRVDPEEIILELKKIIELLQKKNNQDYNEKNLPNSFTN